MRLFAFLVGLIVATCASAVFLNRALWGYWGFGVRSVVPKATELCSAEANGWCAVASQFDRELSVSARPGTRFGYEDSSQLRLASCPAEGSDRIKAPLRAAIDALPHEKCTHGQWATCRISFFGRASRGASDIE